MLLEEIKTKIEAAIEGCSVEVISNASPSNQGSLLIPAAYAVDIARFLREDQELLFDYCSNATGVDWLDTNATEKIKVMRVIDGIEKEIEETRSTTIPGFLEAVYHLYSMERRHGPLVIRMRTADRKDNAHLPSLTPVWRSAELQEREIFDLFGITFDGHPDLRRILMWDEFQDYPMRKDYVEPDDYEYEPTAHGDVLAKARQNAVERSQ